MHAPKSSSPLVTVVIPVYNRAETIDNAIKTAANQLYRPLEIIVVDDGSSDSSARVAENTSKNHNIEIDIVSIPSSGASTARNVGIDTARGSYIAFLDCDDEWKNDKLTAQMAALLRTADPKNTISYCQAVTKRPGRTVSPRPSRAIKSDEYVSEYIFQNGGFIQTSTLIVPVELAKSVRFKERLPRHQDWDFVLRLEQNGANFQMLNEPLVRYDDSPSPKRISRNCDPLWSLQWIDEAPGVTSEARSAFVANLAPEIAKHNRFKGVKVLFRNLKTSGFSASKSFILVAQTFIATISPYLHDIMRYIITRKA